MNKYKALAKESKINRIEESSCKRKKPFETKEKAMEIKNQDVYMCKFCGKWHRSMSVLRTLQKVKNKKFLKYSIQPNSHI